MSTQTNSKMVYVVGIGPGNKEFMTTQAYDVLNACDVIVGYSVYVDLIKPVFPQKEYATTPMKEEIKRCKMCLDYALSGKSVAMICSGDAGVYGMAAPMLELLEEYRNNDPDGTRGLDISIIPGITAASSGAAVLGAPLNHDFCVISLSDLLTPWEIIEKRLIAAIQGDFAIAIYNPSSHKRKDYLKKACEIMLAAGASENRSCGYVENIGREGTSCEVCTLGELKNREVNMFTTVFIGNSNAKIIDGKLVTPRGYKI